MKNVVITGGTRGIGAGLVREFLRCGWSVVYSGATTHSVNESIRSLSEDFNKASYAAFKCDVTDVNDLSDLWDSAIKTFGRIDIWVNNAGISNERMPFNELTPAAFIKVIDTNLKGLMMATHIAYNRMLLRGSGAIYNMGGLGSDGRTVPGLTPYGTSKQAVSYFTNAFAEEVKKGPVIVGTLRPGMVLTDMLLDTVRNDPDKSKQLIKIYNILANDPETVTPFLVKRMILNKKNGAIISWLSGWKIMKSFFVSPFLKRDIVSKYL